MGVTYMDARSAKLAIELLLEDVNSQLEGLYDDPPEGDALSSLEAMKAGLCEQLQVLEGSVAALDILKGEYINRLTFKKLLDEEKQAVADHQLAMELGGLKVGDPKLQSCAEYKASLCGDKEYNDEEEQWQLAKKVYAFETDSGVKSVEEVKDPTPQNGIQIAKSKQVGFYPEPKAGSPELERRCNACMESFPAKETLSLRCAPEPHIYCRGCLINLFQTAIVDTSLFPPRCCRATIPLDMCRALLPKQMIHDFDSKVEELATPNPTNCSDPDCSKFIRLANISNNKAKCACGRITCVLCKEMDHSGKDCPEDPHVKLLMDVAKRSKWQKCGKCKTLVELASGCYHMKCRCTYQFCYLCGVQWKNCTCPHFEESNLLYGNPGVGARLLAVGARLPVIGAGLPARPPGAGVGPGVGVGLPVIGARPPGVGAGFTGVGAGLPGTGAGLPGVGTRLPTALLRHVHEQEGNTHKQRPCTHERRHRVTGPNCTYCRASLLFVMECDRCGDQSCWRCINNRA